MKVTALAVPTAIEFASGGEVIRIDYALGTLDIQVQELGSERMVSVRFTDIQGFRVLDEHDLLHYWPTCSTPNGWIYEIGSGGWLSEEIARGSLVSSIPGVREYLVTGEEDCVSVLTLEAPTVEQR
jgi:hypothetical protein